MSRRKAAPKRKILPDPKFGNLKVAKFMNQIMTDGKKSIAEKIIYGAFDEISKKSDKEPVEVFEKALDEVGPMVEVKARRVGGATYQIPLEVRPSRRSALAMRWIAKSARSRNEKTMTFTTDSLILGNQIDHINEIFNNCIFQHMTYNVIGDLGTRVRILHPP